MGSSKKHRKGQHTGAVSLETSTGNDISGNCPRRVLLLRHGESEANATMEDVPDSLLTAKGHMQASAWRGHIGALGAEIVLISPLRRAVQTACLAFAGTDVPFELCKPAREMWWDEKQNTPGTPKEMRSLLDELPRGRDVLGVDDALIPSADDPANEEESIQQLSQLLNHRPESRIAVVCHYGVIQELCGVGAMNAQIVECRFQQSGRLKVTTFHRAPATRGS
eukprot:TRINITY_DN45238_c0_g1_i1.p1 TRINITY_DN45238_c0_g1~~TRINITY_DN45238_c0_g1_i1.p1  ORF type:complete len:223 (-),score=26.75 TRINITY_DN45238_c0_g1_i1:49-717(-)